MEVTEKKMIGLMSGTSLDGLDVAYCDMACDADGHFSFRLLAAETIPYPTEWVERLSQLDKASALEYALADVELGHYMGRQVADFRRRHQGEVDAIASHGHTVFHQPQRGLTTQIGDGDAIAAETGLPVVFNFRRLDVALGGQGAPLVPVGDRLLFGEYGGCLNLGGFSNISYEKDGQRVAFDVSPCNMALNHLARMMTSLGYDKDGMLARAGKLDSALLNQLNALPYYRQLPPKSLGKEWFETQFLPLIASSEGHRVCDVLRTVTEHIAMQVAAVVNRQGLTSLLVTGGGAKNTFLVERMQALMPECRLEVPEADVIDYKEAIVFALLGFLRLQDMNNCLSSVTGARMDNCGGDIAGCLNK